MHYDSFHENPTLITCHHSDISWLVDLGYEWILATFSDQPLFLCSPSDKDQTEAWGLLQFPVSRYPTLMMRTVR